MHLGLQLRLEVSYRYRSVQQFLLSKGFLRCGMVSLGVFFWFGRLGIDAGKNLVQIVDNDVLENWHLVLNFCQLLNILKSLGRGSCLAFFFSGEKTVKSLLDMLDKSSDGIIPMKWVKFRGALDLMTVSCWRGCFLWKYSVWPTHQTLSIKFELYNTSILVQF